MSKLTKEQLIHYVKGGKFIALYNPKITSDLTQGCHQHIGKEIEVYQNMLVAPIISISGYWMQHAFNSDDIDGWFPEEDIEIIRPINEFIPYPEDVPVYMYLMHHISEESILANFGWKNASTKERFKPPMRVGRQYSYEKDEYVINELCNPQADKIEKAIWDPFKTGDDVIWETIFELPS